MSTGIPQVAVPNVVGLAQAGGDIRDHGCESDRRNDHDGLEHDGAGRLGDQSVADGGHAGRAGQRGHAGRVERAAAGCPTNVVGLTQAAGDQRHHRRESHARDGDDGRRARRRLAGSVISQTPTAGTQVAQGSAVTLVVSSGRLPRVAVPNVVGLTQAASATSAITGANLNARDAGDDGGELTTGTAGSVISRKRRRLALRSRKGSADRR